MDDSTQPQGFLARGWQGLNDQTIGSGGYWSIAVQNRSAYLDMVPIVKDYVSGAVLDVGAGRLAWRADLKRLARSYASADVERCHPDIDHIVDLTGTLPGGLQKPVGTGHGVSLGLDGGRVRPAARWAARPCQRSGPARPQTLFAAIS